MQAIGLIPARLHSTRLHQKMLIHIEGKPLIQHTYENTLRCQDLNDVIIVTDSDIIKKTAESFGAQVIITSPHHPSGTDRIAEAVQNIQSDIVVNLQGDEPCLSPQDISSLINLLKNDDISFATLAHPMSHTEALDENNVKVVLGTQKQALYFSRSPIPFCCSPEEETSNYLKHIGVYAYRKETLLYFTSLKPSPLEKQERLEQLRAIEYGIPLHVHICKNASVGIDTQKDIDLLKKHFLYSQRV